MPPKKAKTAVESVTATIDGIKQRALLQYTQKAMEAQQISLFDVAPWSDDQRAMPNVFARSALFTIRNKTAKREVRQGAVIFHAGKDSTLTYTGIELRADDDEAGGAKCQPNASPMPARWLPRPTRALVPWRPP